MENLLTIHPASLPIKKCQSEQLGTATVENSLQSATLSDQFDFSPQVVRSKNRIARQKSAAIVIKIDGGD